MSKLIENQQIKNFVEEVDIETVKNNDVLVTRCLFKEIPNNPTRILCLLESQYTSALYLSEYWKVIQDAFVLFDRLSKSALFLQQKIDSEDVFDTIENMQLINEIASNTAYLVNRLPSHLETPEVRKVIKKYFLDWVEKHKDNGNLLVQDYIKSVKEHFNQDLSDKITIINKQSGKQE